MFDVHLLLSCPQFHHARSHAPNRFHPKHEDWRNRGIRVIQFFASCYISILPLLPLQQPRGILTMSLQLLLNPVLVVETVNSQPY